jgi:hypothetical protein
VDEDKDKAPVEVEGRAAYRAGAPGAVRGRVEVVAAAVVADEEPDRPEFVYVRTAEPRQSTLAESPALN